jgi:glycerophosphoryl diester phosphodiesterase
MAIDLGAHMIEADLRFTRDGVPVMLHDPTLDRTTSGHGAVDQADWATVSQLDAGGWFDPRFDHERVPRLEDLFELADARGIALCIEAKGKGAENRRSALHAAREIARRDRLDSDVVASFDHEALAAAIDAVPGLRTAPDRLPERGTFDRRGADCPGEGRAGDDHPAPLRRPGAASRRRGAGCRH